MGYVLLTAPAHEPLTLDETKAHLRVDHSDDDAVISRLIPAARAKFERDTNRRLVTQQWRMSLDHYVLGPLATDYGPVQSIDQLRFTDLDNAVTVVDPSQYLVDVSAPIARVTPPVFQPWPWIYWMQIYRPFGRLLPNAIMLDFTVGYGAIDQGSGALTPADGIDTTQWELIKGAILMIVGHWFSNRETVLGGEGRFMAIELPMASQDIIESFRIDRLR